MITMASSVYDLIYPSPVTLRELSCIAVGIQLWHWKLDKHRALRQTIPLKSVIPDMPLIISRIVEEYVKKLEFSIAQWRKDHFDQIFRFHLLDLCGILLTIDDFFYDWDGTVHYVRTAKKMIQCDRFSEEEKFKIACMYCFEDDIRRIWPSVSNNVNLDEIDFDVCPNLYYWVCLLKNELEKMSNILELNDESIEEAMLDACASYNWSAVEYFWSRIPLEIRSFKALDLYLRDKELFCRFILPRLNESELDRFVTNRGCELIVALLKNRKSYVLSIWVYIGSKIKENNFVSLVEKILKIETNRHIAENAFVGRLPKIKELLSTEHDTYICCEIWKSARHILKQSALKKLSSLPNKTFRKKYIRPSEPREVKFLLTMLLDATFEDRTTFWYKNWHNLIVNSRTNELHRIMSLCFKNESEITRFKENTVSEYDNISPYCVELLTDGYFEELDNFLSFCCVDVSKKRELKRRLIQLNFLGEETVLNVLHFGRVQSMNEFIYEAFDDPNLAADFKNQLVSLPATEQCLFECIRYGYFPSAMEFVQIFISSKQLVMQLKERFVEWLRNHLRSGFVSNIRVVFLQAFLDWCLEDNSDDVDKFKDSISVNEIFNNMVDEELSRANRRNGVMIYPHNLDQFLMWYFNTPEEVDEFRKQFSDIFKMFSTRKIY